MQKHGANVQTHISINRAQSVVTAPASFSMQAALIDYQISDFRNYKDTDLLK
jgi:hypothetical protein